MTHRERWQALQAHLTAARVFVEAGDDQRALVEVKAALALDPDFLAAQSLLDRIVKKSVSRSTPATPRTVKQPPLATAPPVVSLAGPPPTAIVRSSDQIAPDSVAAAVVSAEQGAAPAAIAPMLASPPLAAPAAAATAIPTLPDPIVPEMLRDTGVPGIPASALASSVAAPAIGPGSAGSDVIAPPAGSAAVAAAVALGAADVPLVSTEGYARFEARARRRRVDRRIEAARAAMERKRLHEAAVALDEIITLDPNLPELVGLTAEFDELRKAVASPRRGPWLIAAAVFFVSVLGASWLHESSLLVSYPVTGSVALISPPAPALTGDSAADAPPVATAGVGEAQHAIEEPELPRIAARPARSETVPAVLRGPVIPERDRPAASPSSAPVSDVAIPAISMPVPPPAPAQPPVVTAPAPPPSARATAAPVAAPVNTPPPPVSAVPTVDDESLVKQTLQRYRHAYEGLDARSAHAVWPSVDQAALARAFGGLTSQSITFDRCDVQLSGGLANATCRGTARYVPKIGNHEPRIEPRVWSFALRKDDGEWKIDSARAER